MVKSKVKNASALRAPTSSTAARLHLIVQTKNSDQLSIAVPGMAQNDSKRTAENSATDKRTEGIRSMACDREKVRSDAHVGPKFSICSIDQEHL